LYIKLVIKNGLHFSYATPKIQFENFLRLLFRNLFSKKQEELKKPFLKTASNFSIIYAKVVYNYAFIRSQNNKRRSPILSIQIKATSTQISKLSTQAVFP
jgi:hypothetical protein